MIQPSEIIGSEIRTKNHGMDREKIKTKSLEYAESIIDTVHEPLIVLDQDLRAASVNRSFTLIITSSIGISIYPDHGEDIDIILKNADSAMYRAKQSGRNQNHLYKEV